MVDIARIQSLLRRRGRGDLADLLSSAAASVVAWDLGGAIYNSDRATAEFSVPIDAYEHLRSISDFNRDAILEAVRDIHPHHDQAPDFQSVRFVLDPVSLDEPAKGDQTLLELLEAQRSVLIAVATGGPRINDVNDEYIERRARINAALSRLGLVDPVPYADLWEWYGKWSSGDLPTWQSRREYITGLFEPLVKEIRRAPADPSPRLVEPTGWTKVDRVLGEVRRRLEEAHVEEQYQAVGLLCREVLISVAQMVYSPSKHPAPPDKPSPSSTDAKGMLDAYLSSELSNSSNAVIRKHAKAAVDLANELQHRQTADFRQAALCAEATTSVTNLIAIISGRRDPNASDSKSP